MVSKANLRWSSPAMASVAALVVVLAAMPTNGQIPVSPCTASMLTSLTPCINFLTNSTVNMTTPTSGCCTSLKALASNGTGCFCQVLNGGVPFRVPINRTSALSLPRSCNMPGVPLQCNLATGSPAAAPGPSSAASSPSPSASTIPTASSPIPAEGPVSDATPTTATSPTASTETPSTSTTPGKTSNPATSAAQTTLAFSPSFLLIPVSLLMMYYI